MPPAGLEPAALCLASSIRLSLTARQSWGCWLDYILDITVPTRIVSEDPSSQTREKVSCGLPNPHGLLLGSFSDQVPEALRASPHTGSSTQWVPTAFPIKAPTRQMLYPLSYRGTFNQIVRHVNTSKTDVNRSDEPQTSTEFGYCFYVPCASLWLKTNKKRSPKVGDLFLKIREISLRCARVFLSFSEHATAVQRIINDLAHCRSFWIDVHSVARFEVSDDTFRSYLKGNTVQLRKTARLNVINSHKPLI